MNKFTLENKNIIITGASSGIGRQCAKECNKTGARIVFIGRNKDRLESLMNELKGDNKYIAADITNFENLKDIVEEAYKFYGKIDGFIHSAGAEMTKPLSLTKPIDYENIYKINVISGFEIARILSNKKYINEKGSSFVFISSVLGTMGKPATITYCATKGALIAGMKAMALELAYKKIRVNCVSPGVVNTELTKNFMEKLPEEARNEVYKMHPLGIGEPEDVANVCVYLLSNEARWITGSNLVVDGGYSAR